MKTVWLIGLGFVADLYMRSLQSFPDITVGGAYDRVAACRARFSAHWHVPVCTTLEEFLAQAGPQDLILNLTNPGSHFEVSAACLRAGHHVYSEKPLAMTMDDARILHGLAQASGLHLASAPCSLLGEAAQILWRAVRQGKIGRPLLVYAEMDDGFISQAPYREWKSESGAPWPYEDEFRVGCTVEHAGYYLTWLIAIFGPVRRVVAASAELDRHKLSEIETAAPDTSVAVLFFDGGVMARLTCSILARHDHSIRIFGETGTLEIAECWDNDAPVRLRQRRRLRRRLVELPWTRRLRLGGPSHPKMPRRGSAAMNFALGPAELLDAIAERRQSRLSADLALHLNEVTLAIQSSGTTAGSVAMSTTCSPIRPMAWAEAEDA
ncbi:MAG: Gfo/Idh/MocA family oxidoreductase [Alphaproteobacteria bacterium]